MSFTEFVRQNKEIIEQMLREKKFNEEQAELVSLALYKLEKG